MIIFYFLLGTAIRVIVNLNVNQVACGSLASTASDSESDNVNDACFGQPVGSSYLMTGCIIKPIWVHKVYNSEKHIQ